MEQNNLVCIIVLTKADVFVPVESSSVSLLFLLRSAFLTLGTGWEGLSCMMGQGHPDLFTYKRNY